MSGALRHAAKEPVLITVFIYDLPNRDCAALASNGELTISNIGLQRYEQDYINPIARILTNDADLDAFSRLTPSRRSVTSTLRRC